MGVYGLSSKRLQECQRAEAEAEKLLRLLQEEAEKLLRLLQEDASVNEERLQKHIDKEREVLLASKRLQECQRASGEADRSARRLSEEEVGLTVQRPDATATADAVVDAIAENRPAAPAPAPSATLRHSTARLEKCRQDEDKANKKLNRLLLFAQAIAEPRGDPEELARIARQIEKALSDLQKCVRFTTVVEWRIVRRERASERAGERVSEGEAKRKCERSESC